MAVVRAYVDGFNLYYGALKQSEHKWLDVAALADRLAGERVSRVVYCTARIKSWGGDSGATTRQDVYLRALAAEGRIDVYFGKFRERSTQGRRVPVVGCACCEGSPEDPCACCQRHIATVLRSEEKGSDVQLAVQLVRDAYEGRFDRALLISNDSDLQPAVDVVVKRLGLKVTIVNPYRGRASIMGATSQAYLSVGLLRSSQFPDVVQTSDGREIQRPAAWARRESQDRSPGSSSATEMH